MPTSRKTHKRYTRADLFVDALLLISAIGLGAMLHLLWTM